MSLRRRYLLQLNFPSVRSSPVQTSVIINNGGGRSGGGGRYMQAWMWKITKGAAVAEVHSIEPKDPLELQGMRCNLSIGGIALKNKTQPLGEMRRQGVKCLCFLFALSGCFSSKHAVGLSAFSSSFGLRVSCIRSFCV